MWHKNHIPCILFVITSHAARPESRVGNRLRLSMGGAAKSHGKACGYLEGYRIVIAVFHSCDLWIWQHPLAFFAGLSNGEGPVSESDVFQRASAELVKYMNSGSQLLHKNFLKQDVVQKFLRLLSSLQGKFSRRFNCVQGGLCSLKLFLNIF